MKRFGIALLGLLWAGTAFAAGSSITWATPVKLYTLTGHIAYRHAATVVSDNATGAASGTTTSMAGIIDRVSTDPAGGALAPDDNWGCTLLDASGADVLGGAISANRDTSNSENAVPLAPSGSEYHPLIGGTMTLSCAAMGNSNQAVVYFWVLQ